MKLGLRAVVISDTHLQHSFRVPFGDLLLHCGDLTGRGTLTEINKAMEWLGDLPHTEKIFIAGNHDFLAERDPGLFKSLVPKNVTYLQDSGYEWNGLKFWGSPVTPRFFDWAFNVDRGPLIRRHWDMIPEDTDVLLTHGPPYGLLDKLPSGMKVGCRDLTARLEKLSKLKIHAFGHIHHSYGVLKNNETVFVNAATCNENYNPVNEPIVLDI
jgi:Icc-related predicted phosphoesterase